MAAVPIGRVAGDLFATVLLFHASPETGGEGADALRARLLAALDAFAREAAAQGVPPDEVEEARFALVAWTDEMVQRTAWSGGEAWHRQLLQLQLYNTNRAGNEFFEHLARLRPEQNHAREIYFLCLAFGFEGQYAGMVAELRALMQQQFEMLRAAGRAQSVASTAPVTPAAYDLDIRLPARGAGGARAILLGWTAVAVAVFAVYWLALTFLGGQVPVPPGS